MYFVYIIKSECIPNKFYVGSTQNVRARLIKHNGGGSVFTKDYKPWKLVWYACFQEKAQALKFEKYLKTYSGRAFMQKRLV